MICICSETPADIAAIETVTIAAFRTAAHASGTESLIVRALREAGQLSVSRVAEREGIVIGHAAASPVTISDGSEGWYGLGPVSVEPAHQRQGVGARLVAAVLVDLRSLGAAGCVVLGDPLYYARFGFRAEASLVLPEVPPDYFQALAFGGAVPRGTVAYHAAFYVTA